MYTFQSPINYPKPFVTLNFVLAQCYLLTFN